MKSITEMISGSVPSPMLEIVPAPRKTNRSRPLRPDRKSINESVGRGHAKISALWLRVGIVI